MKVDREKALEIAHEDAQTMYRNLELYDVLIEEAGPNWKVDYELKDRNALGGGPHYLISRESGKIVEQRYEQ